MAIDENSMEAEFFSEQIATPTEVIAEIAEPEVTPVADVVPEPVIEIPVVEAPKPIEEAKVWTPEFKKESDRYIYDKLSNGDEKSVYEVLKQKYQYDGFSDEQKTLAYIAAQNPELDDEDLAFMAATEYGIGVENLPDDELTDIQILEIKKQALGRKKLLSQANAYFSEQGAKIELPILPDPIELDSDYKAYKTQQETQKAQAIKDQEIYDTTLQSIETNAKVITEINEKIEIDIDEGKFALDTNFKLNEDRQNQLADFTKRYTPTEDEIKAFTDTQTGKFDYKGYMSMLAPRVFAKEIMAAGMKQALAKDRQQFIEKELKNSTLRNNDVSQTVDVPFDIYTAYSFG